jgi:hypothetical protein
MVTGVVDCVFEVACTVAVVVGEVWVGLGRWGDLVYTPLDESKSAIQKTFIQTLGFWNNLAPHQTVRRFFFETFELKFVFIIIKKFLKI